MLVSCGVCCFVTYIDEDLPSNYHIGVFKGAYKTNVGAAVDIIGAKSVGSSCRWESEWFYGAIDRQLIMEN